MDAESQPQPVGPPKHAVHKGVATELNVEALDNLTGYFDVLIQMDLAQKQRNKERANVSPTLQDNPADDAQAN